MLSANVGDISQAPGPESRHDGVLAKPLSIPQLLQTIQILLQIEWDYGPPELVPFDLAPLTVFPDSRAVQQLLQLGRMGHVRAIDAALASIEAANPEMRAFTHHLRALIKDFDLRRYMSALQEASRHDA